MATLTVKEIHPTTGRAWQRAVELWETYVVNSTWTIAVACGYTDGSGRIRVIINDGTDETTYHLMLGDALDGTMRPLEWFGQSGWMYRPKVKLASYGARDTKTDFNTYMVAARRSVYGFFGTATALSSTANVDMSLPLQSANTRMWYFPFKCGMDVGMDLLCLTVATPADGYEFAEGQAGNGALLGESIQIALSSGGGGSTDLGPVVEAIQDAANKTTLLGLNREGALYAVESGEVIEPP